MTGGEVDRAMALEQTLTAEWYYHWQSWVAEIKKQ